MAFYLDMSALIDMFGTKLTVLANSDDGEWMDGIWHQTDSKEIDLYEPFLTFNINSTLLSGQLMPAETGEFDTDKAYWFSENDYALGTRVKHNDELYRVTGKHNYSDYSNVLEYELKKESPNNEQT